MTSAIKPTPYQVQVKVFEAAGCKYVRTQGDHLVYHYPALSWSNTTCRHSQIQGSAGIHHQEQREYLGLRKKGLSR